jgi:hypothetical protein
MLNEYVREGSSKVSRKVGIFRNAVLERGGKRDGR